MSGLYGYVSATKWVESIELTRWDGVDGYWVPRGWSKDGPVKLASRIDVPRSGATVAAGPVTVAGVAWLPAVGVDTVEVAVDDGPWRLAELGPVASALGNRAEQRDEARTGSACEPPTPPDGSRPPTTPSPPPTGPPATTRCTSPRPRPDQVHQPIQPTNRPTDPDPTPTPTPIKGAHPCPPPAHHEPGSEASSPSSP